MDLLSFSQKNYYTLIYRKQIPSYKPTVPVYDEYKHGRKQFHPDCKKTVWLLEAVFSSVMKY